MPSAMPLIVSTLLLILLLSVVSSAQTDESTFEITGDTLNRYETEVSFYDEEVAQGIEEENLHGAWTRRSLFWGKVMRYYISYGALAANRIPCPPRSGRSYYTHNCHRARGPVHPYTRGCSAITRCRRLGLTDMSSDIDGFGVLQNCNGSCVSPSEPNPLTL